MVETCHRKSSNIIIIESAVEKTKLKILDRCEKPLVSLYYHQSILMNPFKQTTNFLVGNSLF